MKLSIASITIAASCVKAEYVRIKSAAKGTGGKVYLESDSNGESDWLSTECYAGMNEGCYRDANCCDEMECLGINPFNWACGHSIGVAGQACDLAFACDERLVCHEGFCAEYADLLDQGTEGTCREGSPPGELKVQTHNLFLVNCPLGWTSGPVPCQDHDTKRSRIVPDLFSWYEQSDADVVMFQEVWDLRAELIEGMTGAGYCHYISNIYERNGSGLQIFSKYPLEDADFFDYFDLFGPNSDTFLHPEATTDRGVMYAKVTKDGRNYHVANTHTVSTSLGEQQEAREKQYEEIKLFIQEKDIPVDELVVYGGDMNENKFDHEKYWQYEVMLEKTEAFEPEHPEGSQQFSYDTLMNPIPASFQEEDFEELLDYVLVSNNHGQPEESSCEVLVAQYPEDCGGGMECMLSDHFPVLCSFVVA